MKRVKLKFVASHDIMCKGVIKFEGHRYLLIANRGSKFHEMSVEDGYYPLLNINSRTVRAVSGDTIVGVGVEKPENESNCAVRPSRKVPGFLGCTATILEHLSDEETYDDVCRVYEALEEGCRNEDHYVDVAPICRLAHLFLQKRGFETTRVLKTVPNDKFYPPTILSHVADRVSWHYFD